MNHMASALVDWDNVVNDLAILLESLNIGDDADEADDSVADGVEPGTVEDGVESGIVEDGVEAGTVDGSRTTYDGIGPDKGESAAVEGANIAQDDDDSNYALEQKHKIFLSHSGAQKSFVADLCADLMRRDRHPFFDKLKSSLPLGDKFPNLIFEAIKQYQVGVVVLSEEFFTRSKWPMLELVAMVEESKKLNRKIKIILVFYSISCDKCRTPVVQAQWMRNYWKYWEEKDKRIDLKKWKSALDIFGSITGLVKDGMLDGDLRAKIVEVVCTKVPMETRWDDSGVQGKARLYKELFKMIFKGMHPKDMKGGVRVVGLHGMAGIGKTTICKVLYNELSTEYCDKVCHVELGSLGEVDLLRRILGVVSNLDVQRLDGFDVGACCAYLKNRCVKERVFLALDNVSDESMEQAQIFLEAKFGDGSVILVTARSLEQLKCLRIKEEDCLGMPELELEEAKSLFLHHTRLKENEIYRDLLEKCLQRCYFSKGLESLPHNSRHYHPLALRVLGSEVSGLGYDMKRQAALLKRIDTFNLSRRNQHPVFSILRSSFDSLLEEDQFLFLDVALFLERTRVGFPCTALEWLGMVYGKQADDMKFMLDGLKRKSLLESFGETVTEFSMHDLWREFAVAEIKAVKFRKKRWISNGEGCNGKVDLTECLRMEAVKLVVGVAEDVALDVGGLKHLKSLELIPKKLRPRRFTVVKLNGLATLEKLTFLRWKTITSCKYIAELGSLPNLVVVDLEDYEDDNLPDMSKLINLQILNLSWSRSLQSINLQNLPNLMRLCLQGCWRLRKVDISGCRAMTELQDYWHLYDLEELNVSSCRLLPSLPGLSGLTKLRKLDIAGCSSIREVNGLVELIALEELRITKCQNLELPDITKLTNLQVLDIEPTKQPVISNLTNLKALDIKPTKVQVVTLKQFGGDKLPDMSKFTNLRILNLQESSFLQCINLQNLTNLRRLCWEGCKSLRQVDISGCRCVSGLPSFFHIRALEELDVSFCSSIFSLPGLSELTKLRKLDITSCSWIRDLDGLGELVALEELRATECQRLSVLPACRLPNLRILEIELWKAPSSAWIAEHVMCLTILQVANLEGFRGDKLPDMSKFTNLLILNLRRSRSLHSINLQRLTNLTRLCLGGCKRLRKVDISGCRSMTDLQDYWHSPALVELNVSYCPLIPSLPNLLYLTKLQKLDISGCSLMTGLYGLEFLVALEELRAMECENLAVLPQCRLPKLRVLDIEPSKVPLGFEWAGAAEHLVAFSPGPSVTSRELVTSKVEERRIKRLKML